MKYKYKSLIFLFSAIGFAAVIPAVNIIESPKPITALKLDHLFNLDRAQSLLQIALLPFGISLSPHNAIIGSNDWFYLGDNYASTISRRRSTQSNDALNSAQELSNGLKSWDGYFTRNGVSEFAVLVGPDKASVYPEHLPKWALPTSDTYLDILSNKVRPSVLYSPKNLLIDLKQKHNTDLYFKTDTHWNEFGAWYAFTGFMEHVRANSLSEISTPNNISFETPDTKFSGDLLNFLYINDFLSESYPIAKIKAPTAPTYKITDFISGELIASSDQPNTLAPQKPVLTENTKALNNLRVLWLRDSFGNALSKYMSTTFSSVLQIHYGKLDSLLLDDLTKSYKPDLVFITAVERALPTINIGRSLLPQTFFVGPQREKPENYLTAAESASNHITLARNKFQKITGKDPFIVFTPNQLIETSNHSKISFTLRCNNEIPTGIQLFWRPANGTFSEGNSIRFSTPPGPVTINLSEHAQWTQSKKISHLRLDLTSLTDCNPFLIEDVIVH
jgi:alginate O-acetyltransferase complex protein AlgJ